MAPRGFSSDRLWVWFGVSSVVCLAVLAISPVKDYFREYRRYQNEYRDRLVAAAGTSKELRAAQAETVHVRQIWLPELDNRVDRCVSCHLGGEDSTMAGAPEPFRTHPVTPHTPGDVQRFGCVVCHRGQGRATSVAEAHGAVADWDSPILPLGYTEASCGVCHDGERVPEASLLSEGRALMDQAGCYACHLLPGHEDWQSVAPDLDGLGEKTSPEWLRAWLKAPAAVLPATKMPDFRLSDEDVEALTAFLWTRPPKPGATVPGDPLPKGDAGRGKTLFRESRCISCHTVEGRGNGSAPELGTVGSKVRRAWLVAYLADPHAFQPRTPMPRYDFERQDLLDLSQYLVEEFVDPEAPPSGPEYRPAVKLQQDGEELFRRYGCRGCHRIGEDGERIRIGPDLTGVGLKPVRLLDFGAREDLPRRLPDWLAAKITSPRSFREGLKMPVLSLEPQQVQALVTALLSQTGQDLPESYRVPAAQAHYDPPGRFGELVDGYRCLSCHQVRGVGGDISTAPLTAEGSKVKRDWLQEYLLLPTTLRPLLTDRMIPLRMSEEEAAFLADFMENVYLDDSIPGEIFPSGVPPEASERGGRLFYQRYGCQACHQLGRTGGYYGPLLDDAPGMLKSGWIAWWLRGPQRWRDDVRCPDYGLDETDARDLAAFLSTPQSSANSGRAGR
jgi:cytochrome c2